MLIGGLKTTAGNVLGGIIKPSKARRIIDAGLNPFGFAIARTGSVPNLERALEHLRKQGFSPATVYDIGVAYGTPQLYRIFPHARYHLIDPLKESLPFMEAIARDIDAEIHNCALGEEQAILQIEARRDLGASTLLREFGPTENTRRYEVPIYRFDQLFAEIEMPSLCKIDVQGYELPVLRGMGSLIADIDVFVVEASLIATLEGGAEFADVFELMTLNGFVLYDIGGLGRRPIDSALTQVDFVFVKSVSNLRAEKRWADSVAP